MEKRTNRRQHVERYVKGSHLKINELRERAQNQYLRKTNIPAYPRPEIHVFHLKHDTDKAGLQGIKGDGGFKDPGEDSPKLLWWSLAIGPEDMTSAETRLLEKTYPDRTQEQAQRQQSFLWRFATSPAFKETSRMGSYRFTFPLEELLEAYRQQCCSGAQPVMRVFETVLYQQQVMYVVLVHSPANQEFSEYPELTDDPNAVCVYRDGRFIWRPEAMCETHRYELIQRPDENLMDFQELFGSYVQFYVWDHVAVALHMEEGKVLEFGLDRLRKNLKFCDAGEPKLSRNLIFQRFEEAEEIVKGLWPDYPAPLEKELPLHQNSAGLTPENTD